MDNLELLCIADRNVKRYRKEYGGSSKTNKTNWITLWSGNSPPRYTSKRIEIKEQIFV